MRVDRLRQVSAWPPTRQQQVLDILYQLDTLGLFHNLEMRTPLYEGCELSFVQGFLWVKPLRSPWQTSRLQERLRTMREK